MLSDKAAKKILRNLWPAATKAMWPVPTSGRKWIRAQPKDGSKPGPRLSQPGATAFTTQPDGLWLNLNGLSYCDVICIEVSGSIQNLNDKRSRYMPTGAALMLSVSGAWLAEKIAVQGGGEKKRQLLAGIEKEVSEQKEYDVPVRHLRVLYSLPTALYRKWGSEHVPTGYEFFCEHQSLNGITSQKMRRFFARMILSAHFLTKF